MPTLQMRVKAWYGDERIALPIPDGWHVEVSKPPHAAPLLPQDIEDALLNPIGTPPLRELARRARSAAIVVEDMTRPTPTAQILPFILRQLHAAGLDEDSIRFVMALGGHRQMPRQEMVNKLGAEIVGRYEVLNHDLAGRFLFCGRSRRGTPIYINEAVMSADVKLLVGTTYPRPGTGFGGGAKCLVPGVAAMATIESYHHLRGGQPLNPDNEMRHDIEEIARHVGIDVIVNAVLNGEREIVGLFAGDIVEAHRAAADLCKQVNLFPLIPDVDVVISNNYPFDTNMRYTWRGSWPFAFHPDAMKLLVDYCPEGSGYHQLFKARGRPFAVRNDGDPAWHLFSPEIGPKEAYEVHPDCRFHGSWDSLLREVEGRVGPTPRVAFYPQAGICWRV